MKHAVLSVIVVLGCCGCATIFNRTSQYVPLQVPEGTTITDIKGTSYPIVRLAQSHDSGSYVRLSRNKEHHLRFTYHGMTVPVMAERSYEAKWLAVDFLFWPVIFVDLATGAWYSFNGMRVHFPADSSAHTSEPTVIYFEPSEEQLRRIGGNVKIGVGWVFPSDIFLVFPNAFFFGGGYKLSSDYGLEFSAALYSGDMLLPANTAYFDLLSNQATFHLGGYYRIFEDLSVTIGAGVTDLVARQFSSRPAGTVQTDSSGVSKLIGSASMGIRYDVENWFVEVKHLLGFSSLVFPNDERGRLQATSMNIGFLAHF